jgi:hypothetical protein
MKAAPIARESPISRRTWLRSRSDKGANMRMRKLKSTKMSDLIPQTNYNTKAQTFDEKLVQLHHCVPNQIELAYITKDDFKVGFVAIPDPNPNPSLFCSVRGAESAFLPAEQLPQLGALIENGIDYLKSITPS